VIIGDRRNAVEAPREGDNVIIIHAHIGKVKNFRTIVKRCFFRKA
jgi:hypothetical protein